MCLEGFESSGHENLQKECLDIDECMENTHLCILDSDYINNEGSYECECYEGFVGDGFRECINDNECLHRNVKGYLIFLSKSS